MGTAVLRPNNLMVERFRIQATTSFQRHRRNFPARRNSNPSPSSRSDNKRRSDRKHDVSRNGGAHVTLLKRGESLDSIGSIKSNGGDSSTNRKPTFQIRVPPQQTNSVYAGSAFFSSPSPRNLPLPSFSTNFNKKSESAPSDDDELASRDLRRLLRLN